ncbi:hypothetical protein GOP47_0028149 [Adiantum capillus-veneris]|nr:hypothetical protein GOP47_0028149 [Adiantum capillus-veneris]
MLRVLRRHAIVRAPRPALLVPFCGGPSADCRASRDPQLYPSSSDAGFVNPRFKADVMANLVVGHAYSNAAKTDEEGSEPSAETKAERSSSSTKTLEDFQHEEIVGPTVERDMSPVADELRQAHVEMREAIRKFSKGILWVGAIHLVWGGMMFRAMDSPFSHALMTQVCASALVLFSLAYYSKQALKHIEFFTRLEERSRLQILTLSLQATKTLSSFFQRSYGVGLVLLVALIANLVGCLKFLF